MGGTNLAHAARLLSRQNGITNTSSQAPGYLQANLLILPSKHAQHFHDLCLRNPVSCPLLGVTPKGDPRRVRCIKTDDFDLRSDFPAYRVYEKGKCIGRRRDLHELWTSEHVGFLIGCSFSFEDALVEAGLQPRHQKTGTIVSMYRTNIPLLPAGIFTGACYIVSMRPYKPADIGRVRDVTRPYLLAHGEPVAWGWDGAKRLGIEDVHRPDFGEPQAFEENEVPVFWVGLLLLYRNRSLTVQACGVTPQVAVESAGDKIDGLVFAHEPGNMLVTDWTTEDLIASGEETL